VIILKVTIAKLKQLSDIVQKRVLKVDKRIIISVNKFAYRPFLYFVSVRKYSGCFIIFTINITLNRAVCRLTKLKNECIINYR